MIDFKFAIKTFIHLLIISLMLSASVMAQEESIPSAENFLANHGLATDQPVPDFQYESIDGNDIDLEEFEGEYILIDFWGTWCKPCITEAPFLKEAYLKFGDQVIFIGVAVDDREQKVREFNERFGIEWPQIIVSSTSDLVNTFNVKLFPTTFLIGPDQRVLIGANSEEQIDSLKGEKLLETLEEYVDS